MTWTQSEVTESVIVECIDVRLSNRHTDLKTARELESTTAKIYFVCHITAGSSNRPQGEVDGPLIAHVLYLVDHACHSPSLAPSPPLQCKTRGSAPPVARGHSPVFFNNFNISTSVILPNGFVAIQIVDVLYDRPSPFVCFSDGC